ncbi:hypothetical protein AB0F71_10505 [Kitasatospora sp. NPDC028055]|uniref:hypothetical protein n=1 Tax=Kitasatospora sp. NPDC028055 TaxID=3155653 RepID=UPI0033D9DD64
MSISSAVRAAALAAVVGFAVLAAGAGPAAATGAPDTGNTYPAFVVQAGDPVSGQAAGEAAGEAAGQAAGQVGAPVR